MNTIVSSRIDSIEMKGVSGNVYKTTGTRFDYYDDGTVVAVPRRVEDVLKTILDILDKERTLFAEMSAAHA